MLLSNKPPSNKAIEVKPDCVRQSLTVDEELTMETCILSKY
jgi:hypothetical protein